MRNENTSPSRLRSRLEKKYQTKLQIQQNQTVFDVLWEKLTDIRSRQGDDSSDAGAVGGYEYLSR